MTRPPRTDDDAPKGARHSLSGREPSAPPVSREQALAHLGRIMAASLARQRGGTWRSVTRPLRKCDA